MLWSQWCLGRGDILSLDFPCEGHHLVLTLWVRLPRGVNREPSAWWIWEHNWACSAQSSLLSLWNLSANRSKSSALSLETRALVNNAYRDGGGSPLLPVCLSPCGSFSVLTLLSFSQAGKTGITLFLFLTLKLPSTALLTCKLFINVLMIQ